MGELSKAPKKCNIIVVLHHDWLKHFTGTNKIEIMPSWNDYDNTMQCQLIF